MSAEGFFFLLKHILTSVTAVIVFTGRFSIIILGGSDTAEMWIMDGRVS